MSRVQLALDVDDLDTAVDFYTRLLGVEPAKRRPGYANFAIADPPLKLVLLENPGRSAGRPGSLNHLGIEVDSTEVVHAETERLTAAGLLTLEENDSTCCYATQDKVWVTGPGGERWEVYTVKADSQEFGVGPAAAPPAGVACCGDQVAESVQADQTVEPATACC